jgi:hypothetical protein
VFIKPMILWLWIGGAVMALGTLLAAFPGTRRRLAIDPVSAPITVDGPPDDEDAQELDAQELDAPDQDTQDQDTATGVTV